MQTIEIDFEVFKELTIRRESEKMTYNDVIRNLLGLGESDKTNNSNNEKSGVPFVSKNIVFPHGTKLRANYKGQLYTAEIDNGAILYNDQRHTSFSSAAKAVTDNNVNGWIFWDCKRPGDNDYKPIEKVR